MAKIEMTMPKMGESIMEATIITWLKKPGERVEEEEMILEISTDKVDNEIPAPASGVLEQVLFKDGDVVPVGTVIAIIETAVGAQPAAAPETSAPVFVETPVTFGAPAVQPPSPPVVEPAFAVAADKMASIQEHVAAVNSTFASLLVTEPFKGRFYSPLVLNIAREENLAMDELDRLPGTGAEGRVTKKDLLEYVAKRKVIPDTSAPVVQPTPQATPVVQPTPQSAAPVVQPTPQAAPVVQPTPQATPVVQPTPQAAPVVQPTLQAAPSSTAAPGVYTHSTEGATGNFPKKSFVYSGEYEIIEMDRMRKIISENMAYSKHYSPHVTSFVEADVTNLVVWRDKNKDAFEKKYGEKLTFTPIFVEAVARALRDFPMVNVSVDGDKIIVKKDINISLAVALPSGNLIVPSIRKADRLNLVGLATAVNDVTNRARIGKLQAADISDGTYTLSNVGTFGNVMGTPIIMQPQTAVLAVGAIRKKPAVIETPTGDLIGIRQLMFLSHSYDHRVIDGALGGQFVRRVADYLEAFDLNREI